MQKEYNKFFYELGLIVTIFVFLGKLISLGRELSFSYLYGSNIYAESFFFNFNIMNLIAGIFLNTMIFYLVPKLKKISKNSNRRKVFEDEAILLFIFLGLVFQIILVMIFFFVMPTMIGGFGSNGVHGKVDRF